MSEIVLEGLDGTNPLGFMAALGTLAACTEEADGEGPRLSWRREGFWRPVLHGFEGDLIATLDAERQSWDGDPALELSYQTGKGKRVYDLKPPPDEFRQYLVELLSMGEQASRSLELAAAFATDIAVDNNGNAKPTALHFTAGQQLFLDMVRQLRSEVCASDFEEALFGPWKYESRLPSLSWDATVSRDYALRADDPSKVKKLSVPGAEWLAFRSLSLLTSAPVGTRIHTTGSSGRWKTGTFTWCLWTRPAYTATVRSLLRWPDLAKIEPAERLARGIGLVLRAGIRRSDQGGYGSFLPPDVV